MALVAMVIGLPLFFEVGLVVTVPIIFVMAQRSSQPLLPSHPGPLIAVGVLHADLGLTRVLGFAIAIPAVILAGPLYGGWLPRRMAIEPPAELGELFSAHDRGARQPGFGLSLQVILLPVLLMLGSTFAKVALDPHSGLVEGLKFLGEPLIALGLAVLAATALLGWGSGMPRERVGGVLRKRLAPIAALLLTIGAGGGLKQTLLDAAVSHTESGGGRSPALHPAGVADRRGPAPGDRFGNGRDHHHRGYPGAGRDRSGRPPGSLDRAGHRRWLGVLLPRQRRRVLDGA